MTDALHAIVAGAARSAAERERRDRAAVEQAAGERTPRGDAFTAALRAPGVRIIAECKRRSPSRGIMRDPYDPVAIAKGYETAGAAAISVLTEPSFFDGSLSQLAAVRDVVSVPLLRKDFIVTEFQILEARAHGADAVLLIVAAMNDRELRQLVSAASAAGLAALVEVHSRDEMEHALAAGATIVGVNSRNLRTLDVDTAVFGELILGLPSGVAAVAESGLRSAADLRRWREAGYDAFLIGERFMTETDPGAALRELFIEASMKCEEAG